MCVCVCVSIRELLSSDAMKEYNRARVYLDENYRSQEHFTVSAGSPVVFYRCKKADSQTVATPASELGRDDDVITRDRSVKLWRKIMTAVFLLFFIVAPSWCFGLFSLNDGVKTFDLITLSPERVVTAVGQQMAVDIWR